MEAVHAILIIAAATWGIYSCATNKSAHSDNVCPEVQEGHPWSVEEFDQFDRDQLNAARAGCQRHFSSRHCLVRFERWGYHNYRAICAIPAVPKVDFLER